MRENGIRARHKRRYKATTDSKHGLPVADNLLNRHFQRPRERHDPCTVGRRLTYFQDGRHTMDSGPFALNTALTDGRALPCPSPGGRFPRRSDFRFGLPASGPGRSLRQRGRTGALRQRLRGSVDQGDKSGSLRPGLNGRKLSITSSGIMCHSGCPWNWGCLRASPFIPEMVENHPHEFTKSQ